MWFIIALIASIGSTIAFLLLKEKRDKYKLSLLAMMLWGTTLMIFVDHTIAFFEGEAFLSLTTDGLIKSSILLGVVMLVPIFAVWIIAVFWHPHRGKMAAGKTI
jgi:hypothetical protein